MAIMSEDFDRAHWPFRAQHYKELGWTYYCNATERIAAVRGMTDTEQLRAALAVPGLQTTVARAIRKRLRELSVETGVE
jgi:hypothetical protein